MNRDIRHILCPVDFSELAHRALDHAAAMALWYKAPLTVLHVFANVPLDLAPAVPHPADRGQREAELERFVEHVPPEVVLNQVIREARDIRAEILAQVEALETDFLVMGSHGRSGFKRQVLGSVAETIMRTAPCPVMIVPRQAPDAVPGTPVRFSRILCPTDFSESSIRALQYAVDIAQKAGARLTLLHAIEVPPEFRENRMAADFDVDRARAAAEARCMERLRAAIPSPVRTNDEVETVVVEGPAYREVLRQAAAQAIDLIVMGVHGRGAVDLLVFGSNTQQVVRAAHCPVLIVSRAP
ncbi:MAG TPA: universal stress protein [Gemmatimonadaceae bacterium]